MNRKSSVFRTGGRTHSIVPGTRPERPDRELNCEWYLKAINDRFPESAFQIIGITQDDDTEKLKRLLGQREMTWPQV
jgi:hypothetical protein